MEGFKKCDKIFFVKKKHAKHYINEFKTNGSKVKFRIYKCSECEGYHFTSCDAKQVKLIREEMHKDKW